MCQTGNAVPLGGTVSQITPARLVASAIRASANLPCASSAASAARTDAKPPARKTVATIMIRALHRQFLSCLNPEGIDRSSIMQSTGHERPDRRGRQFPGLLREFDIQAVRFRTPQRALRAAIRLGWQRTDDFGASPLGYDCRSE